MPAFYAFNRSHPNRLPPFARSFTRMSDEAGRPITTLMGIVDMEGLTMALATTATVRYIKRMVRIDSAHYPETLGKMLLINVPGFFSLVYALVTPFLDERTQKKIEIIASPAAWKARLNELVPSDRLPTEYGGNLVLPSGSVFPATRTKKSVLPAGSVLRETIPVVAGQTLQLKWHVRPGDIRFAVYWLPGAPPVGLANSVLASTPVPAGAVEVYKDRAHPGSDAKAVRAAYVVPPAAPAGYLLAIYSNADGWRSRELFHRWDIIVDGRPARKAA